MSSDRIGPADPRDVGLEALVARIVRERGRLGELYPVLLRSPGIASGMVELGNGVRRDAVLPARIRELVICRVGILNRAAYEVLRHREIAAAVGVEPEVLDALDDWADSPHFAPDERDALAYADAMTTEVEVNDELFARVARHWSEDEIVELTVTIAYYNMISRILVALRIGGGHSAQEER